jgi:hypothetical protein
MVASSMKSTTMPPETERNVLSGGAKRFYGIWK